MKENANVKHLVMYSGGASSAFVAKWVVEIGRASCRERV